MSKPKPQHEPREIPPILIDRDIYNRFVAELGADWAYSNLRGALISNRKLIPRTETAWTRIKDNFTAMDLLRERRITLLKPPPFRPEPSRQAA